MVHSSSIDGQQFTQSQSDKINFKTCTKHVFPILTIKNIPIPVHVLTIPLEDSLHNKLIIILSVSNTIRGAH
jgi:hypothetical protein